MNFFSAANGLNALCALAIAIAIFLSRTRKAVHVTFALLTLLLFFWTFGNFMWSLQADSVQAMKWVQLLLYPVCFGHIAMFHFALVFTGQVSQYRRPLWIGYGLSGLLALLNVGNTFVAGVRPKGMFPYQPQASVWLAFFLLLQAVYVCWAFWVLAGSIRRAEEPTRTRLIYFLIASLAGWLGAVTNWFYWYDWIPVPPVGNLAITVSVLVLSYLIFRRDILGIKLLRNTFVYALLTLFVALFYAVSIVLLGRLFQLFLGAHSFLSVLVSGALVAILFNPIRGITERFVTRLFFGKDIIELSTENLRMREELLKQDRMKAVAVFAAGMAHEIKNPITAIKVFAEYLPKKYEDPEFLGKFSRIVQQEAARITGIVEDLLLFSKPSEPRRRACDPRQLLKDVADLLSGDLLKQNVEIRFQFNPDAERIHADPDQVKQALLNVMMNGIEAMKGKGGRLSLRTSSTDRFVQIVVEDTGCGIPPENLPHLFDPFFTDKEEGTGLGLAITHAIIEKNGGKISVESETGSWTRFTLALPAGP